MTKAGGRESKIVAPIAFVLRCTMAVTAAYFLAGAAGFPHPLWACIFALVGSQDSVTAIVTTIAGRVTGTIIGVMIAIAVGVVMSQFGLGMVWKIALSVALCAACAWGRPAIQLCLWTPPIIFMTASPAESIVSVGLYRGGEVIIGVVVGGLLLIVSDRILARRTRPRRRAPT
jgi:uncharacterized membrane protein YgaE (UPF0421/DUF939 family)